MDSKFSLQCAAVMAVAALVVGCGPDSSQQGQRQGSSRDSSAQSRPGDSSVARNGAEAPAAGANTDGRLGPARTGAVYGAARKRRVPPAYTSSSSLSAWT